MSVVTVNPGTTSTISTSSSDSVVFAGIGTLNVTGTAQNPITVVLSSVAGVGALDTIHLSYADVSLGGGAGVSALVNYTIGTASTLRVQSLLGVAAGSTIAFNGSNSHLVFNSSINLLQLANISIAGFGPGSNIDLTGSGAASYTYVGNSTPGTGGTLTLLDAQGNATGSVVLTTGNFTTASFNVHPDSGGGTLIDFATTVSGISATPANADLTTGGNVALTVTTTAPVTIAGGTPILTLNDGGTASYDAAHSTGTNLVFDYTVQSGQNTTDLAITGVNLNGASATDVLGNPVSLAGAVGNPAGILQIDTTPPTITGISTTPGSGSLAAGQVVAINLTASEAVTVTGAPTLTLNDGGTATYDASHSTATNLVFNYTVGSGQNTADLTVTGSNLAGATITDAAGNAANLAGAVGNPAGVLRIDTTPPTITGISTTPGSGSLAAGQVVAINLTASEAVTVSGGTPTLTLNDGGTATYDAAHSTATNLVFNYTVQSGQNTADLTVTGSNLHGATIADAAGNAANLGGAVGNPSGTLQIDTTPPTITSIATTPASGSLAAGQVVAINLTPSEAVTVTGGTPTLTLNDGGTATYDAAHSTATNLVFNYTVQSGQNTSDLTVAGSNLNGATIADGAGNAANLAGAIGNPPGTLQIDTTPPTITSISTTPGSGSLAAGQVVAITLTASEAVTVSGGTPTLTLNDGGTAIYDASQSTATNLVFDYIVGSGQNTSDLTVTGSNLHGATITDAAGNAANLAGAVGNPPGTLQIDTTPPTITSISTTPGSGSLAVGQVVAVNLTTSEAVTVTDGTPTLTLNDGGTATYDAAHSTATNLVFDYTVGSGQNTSDLTVIGSNLNGVTIADGAGNAANLAGAVGNPPGTLQVDTTPPTIASISTTPASGTLAAGQVVAFNLTASEAVTVVGGTPTLTLNDGGIATYDAADSTPTNLVFKYVVQPGDNTSDLTVTGSNLNGATIADGAGNSANLAGAVGNPPGTLQINTSGAAVTSVYDVSTTPGSGDLAAGSNVTLQVTLTGNATVSGGMPTMTLSDGGTATYDPSSSTSTSLIFRHTVQPGQNTADLSVTAISLNGATVVDGSNNAVDLSGAVTNPGGILQVDTTAPTISSVTTTPGSGDLAAGQVVAFNLTASEAVTVTGGAPTLTLNVGRVATYDAADSTATNLIFKYVIQPGDNTSDLAVTGSNLNGATITDAAGNAANLAGAVANPPGTLQIDTTSPTVVAVATQPGNGTVDAGDTVAIDVTPSEAVSVSGGTPTLTLSDGGIATYDAAASTPTLMVFDYTVQPGQNTSDLTVTGSNLNGGAITDLAGNAIDLSGVIGNPPGVLEVNTVPVVTSVVATPVNGDLNAGHNITLEVDTSGPVTITGGVPTLSLSDGGTAVYDASSSTPMMLIFRNTIQNGQNTPDLGVAAVFLNGALITDAAGQTVSLSGAIGTPAGILQVDTIDPTALNVVLGGSLAPGGVFTLTANISEPVTLPAGSSFQVLLANGGVATYDPSLSTPTMLVATYTVPAGSNLTAADVATVGFTLIGDHATDGAGNPLNGTTIETAIAAAQGNFSDVTGGTSPTTIDVYRFFDKTTGTHFYTPDQNERQTILATRPDLVPEGPNGVGLTAVDPASNDPAAVPVYRFFDLNQGTQFLTASSSERDSVIATRPDLVYEPSSIFYEHATPQAGDTAVYRFFDTKFGTHFYTDDATERGVILQTRPDLVAEGIGFYEPMRNPAA